MIEKIGEIVGWAMSITVATLLAVGLFSLLAGGAAMAVAILVTGVKFLMSAITL